MSTPRSSAAGHAAGSAATPAPGEQAPSRTVLDPLERREQLVDSAVAAFARRGISHTSITDVAREAGVSRGLVYHYFPTMDDVVDAVLERIVADFVAQVRAWDEAREPGRIDRAVHEIVAMFRGLAQPSRRLVVDLDDPANAAVHQRFVDRAVTAVVDCLQTTTVEAYAARHRIEIAHVRETFTVLVHGLLGLVRTTDVEDEVLVAIVRQVLRLAPDEPAGTPATDDGRTPTRPSDRRRG